MDNLYKEAIQAMSEQFEKKLKNEEKANDIYEMFLKSCGLAIMEHEPFELEGESYTACKPGEGKVELKSDDYPDYYGGAYINDEGDLVIHVVGELKKCQEELAKVIKFEDHYVVKQSHYCYKEFMKLKEYLDELEMNETQKAIFENVTGYGPDDRNNVFLVELNVLDEASIESFKKHISNSDMIVFKQGENIVDESLRPGSRVVRGTTQVGSTLTIRAQRSTANQGFIMSGHGTSSVGESIRPGIGPTAAVGTVRNRHVGGTIDAAYVQRATTNITLSNLIQQNNFALSSARATAAVGTTVNLAGHVSGIRSGSVTAVNVTTTNASGVRLTGSRASYFSQGGDSGGPIYRIVGSQRQIVGIHARSNGNYALIAPTLTSFNIALF